MYLGLRTHTASPQTTYGSRRRNRGPPDFVFNFSRNAPRFLTASASSPGVPIRLRPFLLGLGCPKRGQTQWYKEDTPPTDLTAIGRGLRRQRKCAQQASYSSDNHHATSAHGRTTSLTGPRTVSRPLTDTSTLKLGKHDYAAVVVDVRRLVGKHLPVDRAHLARCPLMLYTEYETRHRNGVLLCHAAFGNEGITAPEQ